ncbi:DUF333 domain-containing protein [Ottowia thiooxydans]|uniref:Hemolysin/membrane-bound inhibitor of C-type lysozyme n=1 Tax=Ottowia thiooxydans TaxID=219182 RepID=A0ABV2QDZ1_9BURK
MHTAQSSSIFSLRHYLLAFAMALIAFAGANSVFAQTPAVQLANPASQHCVGQGGKSQIEKNPAGGQYGICVFGGNRMCEEWAMLRGHCPVGGLRVSGYVTPASRFCAITGGTYKVTSATNTPAELGTCKLTSGKTCSADAYFRGTCTADPKPPAASTGAQGAKPPQPLEVKYSCSGSSTIAASFFNDSTPAQVRLALSDGRTFTLPQVVSADGARYASASETLVFWTKGRTAFIQEGGKTSFADCLEKR